MLRHLRLAKKVCMTLVCQYKGCTKEKIANGRGGRGRYCHFHYVSITIDGFLGYKYHNMSKRVRGTSGVKHPELYIGKPIMPRDAFLSWSRNHPIFLKLYKQWVNSDFDRKLTPVVNRLLSSGGYTLDNVEWITNSQNTIMATALRMMRKNTRKGIYDLLGVKTNV